MKMKWCAYLEFCYQINFRSELEDYAEQQANMRRRQIEHEERKKNEFLARKNHHLISTEVIPGIYNSPFNP